MLLVPQLQAPTLLLCSRILPPLQIPLLPSPFVTIFLVNGRVPSLSQTTYACFLPTPASSVHLCEFPLLATLTVRLFACRAASWPFLLATAAPVLGRPSRLVVFPDTSSLQAQTSPLLEGFQPEPFI